MPAETVSQLLATIVAYVPIAAGAWLLLGNRRRSARGSTVSPPSPWGGIGAR
jgi:hypothetical protein